MNAKIEKWGVWIFTWLAGIVSGAFVVGAMILLLKDPASSGRASTSTGEAGNYKALVRAWLKENTLDGKWEEVRWWPPRTITEKDFTRRINPYGWGGRKEFEDTMSLCQAANSMPRTICRVKLRVQNALGATVLEDELFEIKNGRAKPEAIGFLDRDCGAIANGPTPWAQFLNEMIDEKKPAKRPEPKGVWAVDQSRLFPD